MNTIQRKWLDELRNGDHQQGRGQLVSSDCEGEFYCCLGVAACHVLANVRPLDWQVYLSDLDPFYLTIVGLTRGDESYLAKLNDAGYTFDQIADVLEHVFMTNEAVPVVAHSLGCDLPKTPKGGGS